MARHDFDGDGRSDILWDDPNGFQQLWSANGTGFLIDERSDGTAFNANFAGGAPGWHITDTADFTGDGHADIFWSKPDGSNMLGQIWMWDSTRFIDVGNIASPPVGTRRWIGDFDATGRSDVLQHTPDGNITITTFAFRDSPPPRGFGWMTEQIKSPPISGPVSPDWQIAGIGDFDGNGRDDILWRNDSGLVTDWFSDANGFSPNDQFSTLVDNSWKIAETGDFNGDGRDDVLWRQDGGQITHWLSNGTGFDVSQTFSLNVDPSWHVAQTGDYNGDGRDDILWHNNNGLVTTWLSTGVGFAATDANTMFIGTEWVV